MMHLIIPILLILTVQLVINLLFGFLIKEKHIKGYRIISYIIFIGFAFSLPIVQLTRLIMQLKDSGAPDAIALSSNLNIMLFWVVNIVAMTSQQLIFNIIFLKRIVLRKHA